MIKDIEEESKTKFSIKVEFSFSFKAQTRISKYILHFSPLYAILTLLISAAVLLLYLHRFKASHFRLVPYRNIYPTMNVTV